jgi:hypothetical protein
MLIDAIDSYYWLFVAAVPLITFEYVSDTSRAEARYFHWQPTPIADEGLNSRTIVESLQIIKDLNIEQSEYE